MLLFGDHVDEAEEALEELIPRLSPVVGLRGWTVGSLTIARVFFETASPSIGNSLSHSPSLGAGLLFSYPVAQSFFVSGIRSRVNAAVAATPPSYQSRSMCYWWAAL